MPAPIYICSGADRPDKMPDTDVEAILFNAPSLLQGEAAAKKAMQIIKKSNIDLTILDSGGKQIFEVNSGKSKKWAKYDPDGSKPLSVGKVLHLAPEHVAQTLALLPGISIAMTLDDPVIPSRDPVEQEKKFAQKVQRNVNFARRAVELRNEKFSDIKIFMPLQCQAMQQFENIWPLIKPLGLDGFSLPARCFKKTAELIPFFKRFTELGIQSLHVLGSSRLEIVAILCFLAKNKMFNHLAFDSSSWLMAAINGELILPYSLRNIKLNSREFPEMAVSMLSLDRIYQKYALDDFQSLSKSEQSRRLRTMNFWAISRTNQQVYENADSPESLCAFLEAHAVKEKDVRKIYLLLKELE